MKRAYNILAALLLIAAVSVSCKGDTEPIYEEYERGEYGVTAIEIEAENSSLFTKVEDLTSTTLNISVTSTEEVPLSALSISSLDSDIAEVTFGDDGEVYITGKSAGVATIVVAFADFVATCEVSVRTKYFPDINFVAALFYNGYNFVVDENRGDIDITNQTNAELLAQVRDLEVDEWNIYSLDGIEYFTELEYLVCYGNYITTLNLSALTKLEYLECNNNYNLTELKLGVCTELTYLDCYDCKLTELNIEGFTQLMYLDCKGNNNLSSLKLGGCTELYYLDCSDCNLSALDLSGCTNLSQLSCECNRLSVIDISDCDNLNYIESLLYQEDENGDYIDFTLKCTSAQYSSISEIQADYEGNTYLTVVKVDE